MYHLSLLKILVYVFEIRICLLVDTHIYMYILCLYVYSQTCDEGTPVWMSNLHFLCAKMYIEINVRRGDTCHVRTPTEVSPRHRFDCTVNYVQTWFSGDRINGRFGECRFIQVLSMWPLQVSLTVECRSWVPELSAIILCEVVYI